MYRKEITL